MKYAAVRSLCAADDREQNKVKNTRAAEAQVYQKKGRLSLFIFSIFAPYYSGNTFAVRTYVFLQYSTAVEIPQRKSRALH